MFFINQGESMNLIRNILIIILIMQILIFLSIKLINENISTKTVNQPVSKALPPNHIISTSIKTLPVSSEYTEWNDEKVAALNKKIEKFNKQLERRQPPKPSSPKIVVTAPKKTHTVVKKNKIIPKKTIKIAKQTKPLPKKIKKITKKTKSIPKISIREKIAKYAKTKLGKKYVWGAVGPRSFDCSGFTRAVFKSTTGIKIPRVSRDQAKVGKYVNYKKLKCGDMVFFDTEKKFSGKVNHVGIYLSNGNFIHASSARKKVIITNFNKKPFYKKRFLWGRRVVNKAS